MVEHGVVVQSAAFVDNGVRFVVDLHSHILVYVFRVLVVLSLVLFDRAYQFFRAFPLKIVPRSREACRGEEIYAVFPEVTELVTVPLKHHANPVLVNRIVV